ncbi:hypothetical protein L1987_15166 [Smallanthus sonchifolius]|uniref:Uncharacterized protein n=1 Tax=Smallanthus sonchifolius TaxID=185202 RepID=A0ACB9J574_9ASTR|nr:hypothetical protein L1987_15166 [Smallanthus sonchifolius]
MGESRKEMMKQEFNMFNHVTGENLECHLNHMSSMDVSEITRASTSTSCESKALVSQQGRSEKVQDLEVKQHHAFVVEVTDTEVIKDLCSTICIEKVNRYKHDNDILNQEITKLRYSNPEYKRLEKVFKDTIAESKNDFSKLEMDFSNRECLYRDALKRIDDLSLKLNDAVTQLANTKLTIEKIEHSRSVVYDMIDSQVRKKGNPGIGYHAVEHPFNGNFTSMLSVQHEDVEMEYEGIVEDCGSDDDEEDGRVFESKSASFKNKLSCFQNGTFSKGDKLKGSLTSTFVKSGIVLDRIAEIVIDMMTKCLIEGFLGVVKMQVTS